MKDFQNVTEYLKSVPKEAQEGLKKVRQTIKDTAPETIEVISYQIPTYNYKGKPLVAFAAFKNHCSIYTISKDILKKFKDELKDYYTSGVTIHFSPDKPPINLIKKIVKERIKEVDQVVKS